MFELFLDPTMTYSCGIFGAAGAPRRSLHDAQLAKLDRIIELAQITNDHHVLEIGCGWGSFAIRALQTTGCNYTGITISTEQLHLAQTRITAAGFGPERARLLLIDYRTLDPLVHGRADRLVSIEMLEAVGHENLPAYFAMVGRMTKPGGRAVVQVITTPDDRYDWYRGSSDFIRRHIFPGAHLPSMRALRAATVGTGLRMEVAEDIGLHYATTLRLWLDAFTQHRLTIVDQYSDSFFRKWEFYFAYCEAGFANRYIHTHQIVWSRSTLTAAAESPATRTWYFVIIPLVIALLIARLVAS
jgi:cyclopropane-fatty-acyl-phospholipid synthase